MKRRTFHALALSVVSTIALVGCGGTSTKPAVDGGGEQERRVSDLTGKLEADGSSTVGPITNRASDAFRELYPKIDISVGITGTGNGFKRFVNGETDISDASRPITPTEFAACKKSGIEFLELPIAYDGLTIVKNPENDFLSELTIDDLKKIFLKPDAETWKDINDAWPAEEIKVFAPGTGSGTYDYFFKDVLKNEKNVREKITLSENDNELVRGVAKNKYGIGFFGAAYYLSNKDQVSAVAIVNPKTKKPVLPSLETVESGEYFPFSRPLFIYVNTEAMKRAEGKKFVEYYLKNSAKLAEESRYFPLPADVTAKAMENLRGLKAGTYFVDGDKQREGAFLDLFGKELVSTK
jgi:phosphate transport system substrate-binding protein